jgi:hypothetical protein
MVWPGDGEAARRLRMEPQPLPPPDPAPSLAERLGAAIVDRDPARAPADARRLGLALALLLPLGPALTLAGAHGLIAWTKSASAASAAGNAALRAVAAVEERRELAALGAVSLSATLEAVARALPAEDHLVALDRVDAEEPGGRMTAAVATSDPDRLRSALSRQPLTARWRSTGERRGDGVLIVSLEAVR